MAEGTCYFPGCKTAVITVEDGHHLIGVDIAHIRGAKPGSARYDPNMTDAERAAYPNLILLCAPHHKLVDRLEPAKYPAEVLAEWKAANEGVGASDHANAVVTEANLATLIEEVAARMGPSRAVSVELSAGLLSEHGVTATTMDELPTILDYNPHLRALQRVLVASVRNIGTAAVSVEAVDLHYEVEVPESSGSGDFALMGRNDFFSLNPDLPHRLLDGDALHWYTKIETADQVVRAASPREIASVQARVRLATGETFTSAAEPWSGRLSAVSDGDAP